MAVSRVGAQTGFRSFYRDVFEQEHRHPLNILLHMFGVIASAALLAFAIWSGMYWLALAYPLVHAAPGLLGHRLFERNEEVGDLRITRSDHPLWWFIIGNHVLTADVLFGGFRWLRTALIAAVFALAVGAAQNAAGDQTLLSHAFTATISFAKTILTDPT